MPFVWCLGYDWFHYRNDYHSLMHLDPLLALRLVEH